MSDDKRRSFKRNPSNARLIELINYSSTEHIKNMIKYLVKFDESSLTGDSLELALLTDLKTALGLYPNSKVKTVLTDRQQFVIVQHLIKDRPQKEIAEALNITQQGVSIILNRGLNRVKKCLTNEQSNWTPWTQFEKEFVLLNFNKVDIDRICKIIDKPRSKVISMYYHLRRGDHNAFDI